LLLNEFQWILLRANIEIIFKYATQNAIFFFFLRKKISICAIFIQKKLLK
jgi:hypothetical protein